MPYWKGILMGPAAKSTIIRPFDDIDVLAVFSNEQAAWDKYPPVFSVGNDLYKLPNRTGGWIDAAPPIANQWFATRNQELGNHLAPLVRFAKAWNRTHSKRMRSFHLETVLASVFSSLGSNYRDALWKFFEWAPNRLDVSDPGGQGGDLNNCVTWQGRQDLSSAADRSPKANEAEARGDHDEAKRLWSIVLGDDFPTS